MAAGSSLSSCYQFKWFHTAMFLSLAMICFTSIVSYAKPNILYADHCVSFVSESTPRNPESTTIPFPSNQDGFFLGGNGIYKNLPQYSNSLNVRQSMLFLTHNVYTTDSDDIYKVQASLIFELAGLSYYVEDVAYSFSYSPQVIMDGSQGGPVGFEVEGFWSKSNGKLCMIGSSTITSPEGKTHVLTGVLKLYDIISSNTITSLVKGTLHSLSSVGDMNYFEPLSLLMFPKMNYNYAKGLFGLCSGGIHSQKSKLLNLPLSTPICSIFLGDVTLFELEKDNGCSFMRNCSLSVETARNFRGVMSLRLIQCSTDRRSMRFLLEFPDKSYIQYNDPFLPSTALVVEGSWDAKRSQLCGIACRISNATESLNTSHIEDCSIRLSFIFPSVWSIGKSNAIVGDIWSLKTIQDPSYFNKITFKSVGIDMDGIPGLMYEYTLLHKSKLLCQKRLPNRNKSRMYPDVNSDELRFDISVKISRGLNIGWGHIEPVFVGGRPRSLKMPQMLGIPEMMGPSSIDGRAGNNGQLNVSYRISLPNINKAQQATVQIFAEGIYDSETGEMCMIGCKYLDEINQMSAENISMDCEIFVKLEFPPYDSKDRIQGRVESERDISDPLYFPSLTFSAISAYRSRMRDSIRRMDSEIIMVLISNTLACAIASYQTYYVKKHPGVSSFISLLMLVILSLGQMIPLVTNLEALSLTNQNNQRFSQRSGGQLEINEVFVRVVAVVAFLFQLRLLQNVWSARFANANQMASWSAEKRTVFVCFPLYLTGASIALAMNWKTYKFGEGQGQYISVNGHKNSPWTDLSSYSGLLMDGFLLPQILLNIFHNSNKAALSHVFYMGTTLIRSLPHAYDLYRAHYCNDDLDWSYMYGNLGIGYYSTSWDVIIPCVGFFFAAILYLQQRFCCRFFLPMKFKEQQSHKNVQLALGSQS